jgi:hypothetical protein
VDDTGLNLGLCIIALMASGKPFNPSMTATRDIFKPAVVEFVLPRQPELGSFTLLDPQAPPPWSHHTAR